MKKEVEIKNKGSSSELKNLHRLDDSSQRPALKLLSPDPPRNEETFIQETERQTCRELWNEFVEWLFATLLKYTKCLVLLGLALLIFLAEKEVAAMIGATRLFLVLEGVSVTWLLVEWFEVYTELSIKDLIRKWFDKLFPK